MGDLSGIAGTVRGLFPWLAQVTYEAGTRALSISSAVKLLRLVGGGRPSSGKGHRCGRFRFDPGVPSVSPPHLYYSPDQTSDFVLVEEFPVPGASGGAATWPGASPGTSVVIAEGSARVQIDG